MKNEDKYWTCIVGPVKSDKLPYGADSPPRQAVRNALESMLGKDNTADHCSSGWGCSKELAEMLETISILYPDDDAYVEILEVLRKRNEKRDYLSKKI